MPNLVLLLTEHRFLHSNGAYVGEARLEVEDFENFQNLLAPTHGEEPHAGAKTSNKHPRDKSRRK